MDELKKLNENAIIDCVVDFLVNKPMEIGTLRKLRKNADTSTDQI